MRQADALGRLGGDEFVVIAEELSLAAGPELVAERLLEALKHPFKLGAERGDPRDRDGQHRHRGRTADVGRGAAARRGHRDVPRQVGRQESLRGVRERDAGHACRTAWSSRSTCARRSTQGQFFLAYQPTFTLSDMTPTGVEALIRWEHPTRGIVQPDAFIPMLEETGLITDVGRWVLREACRQAAAWRAGRLPDHDGRQRLRTPARHRRADRRHRRRAQRTAGSRPRR